MNPVLSTPLAVATLLASGAKRKEEEEDGQQEALQDGALEALSEEDLSISGSSARRMVMRKLLRKQEVRVILATGLTRGNSPLLEWDRNKCEALWVVTELDGSWMPGPHGGVSAHRLQTGQNVNNVNQTCSLCLSPL